MSCEPITLQQVFNLAWQTFIVEGKPPSTLNGQCTYRFLRVSNKDPAVRELAKCAIGLALTDDQLNCMDNRFMDSVPINMIISVFPHWFQPAEDHWLDGLGGNTEPAVRNASKDGNIVQRVFRDAQCSLHDYCLDPNDSSKFTNPESMRGQYIAFAKRYKLTIPGENNEQQPDNVTASV